MSEEHLSRIASRLLTIQIQLAMVIVALGILVGLAQVAAKAGQL